MIEQWEGFVPGKWCDEINVRSFIMKNYTEYVGDESFLVGPTDATKKLMTMINELDQEEFATCRGPAPTDPGYSKERWPRRLFIC